MYVPVIVVWIGALLAWFGVMGLVAYVSDSYTPTVVWEAHKCGWCGGERLHKEHVIRTREIYPTWWARTHTAPLCRRCACLFHTLQYGNYKTYREKVEDVG